MRNSSLFLPVSFGFVTLKDSDLWVKTLKNAAKVALNRAFYLSKINFH